MKLKKEKKWLCKIRSHHKYSYRPISQPLREWHSIVIKFNSFSIHEYIYMDVNRYFCDMYTPFFFFFSSSLGVRKYSCDYYFNFSINCNLSLFISPFFWIYATHNSPIVELIVIFSSSSFTLILHLLELQLLRNKVL